MRIVVIEDEPQLARHVSSALTRAGHEVASKNDGQSGLDLVLKDLPDLVVLDINLPQIDGFGVLGRLKEAKSPSRVIMLTARSEVESRIKGLKAGADDYLSKPFSMEELLARVDALGRRGGATVSEDKLKVADLQMDVIHRRVWRAGNPISLSPREFDVLQVFMQEPGRVFSRTELCERVWQRDHQYDTRTVEIFITRLRKKIDAGHEVALIHTQRSVGYSLKAPV